MAYTLRFTNDSHMALKLLDYAQNKIPGYQAEWGRYCYFELTKQETITSDQNVIVTKKPSSRATDFHGDTMSFISGSGIRHRLHAFGDGSHIIEPQMLDGTCTCWVQLRECDREIHPQETYLFCE